MERYIAVDVGKFETKVAYYDKEKDETKEKEGEKEEE